MGQIDRPRNPDGRYIETKLCPVCGNGELLPCEDIIGFGGTWECNGLDDPNDDNKPLVACDYWLVAGVNPWEENDPARSHEHDR